MSFTPSGFPSLTITSPQVWWPYQLGAQPLYTLASSVAQGSTQYNSTSETFGIRTVTSYLAGSNAIEPSGARAFKINGVPIVIRGGGWDPNLFLHYSAADTAKQIALMKNMGLNTIRLEGHIMPQDWFEQMDAAGILVNGGFQCCDAWEVQRQPDPGAADTCCRTPRWRIGAEPAQPPERVQLPVERQPADEPRRSRCRSPGSPRRTSTRRPR